MHMSVMHRVSNDAGHSSCTPNALSTDGTGGSMFLCGCGGAHGKALCPGAASGSRSHPNSPAVPHRLPCSGSASPHPASRWSGLDVWCSLGTLEAPPPEAGLCACSLQRLCHSPPEARISSGVWAGDGVALAILGISLFSDILGCASGVACVHEVIVPLWHPSNDHRCRVTCLTWTGEI